LVGDARDYLLGLPRRSGKDIRVWSDEVGLVLHVEARLAPAAKFGEELVKARDNLVISADGGVESGVVVGKHESVLVCVALLESFLIVFVPDDFSFRKREVGVESGHP